MELLLGEGDDLLLVTQNDTGDTALHLAASKGQAAVIQLLLGKDVDTTVRNNGGHTALHTAAFHGHMMIMQLLLGKGAECVILKTTAITREIAFCTSRHSKDTQL